MEILNCSRNQLSTLDVSKIQSLKELNCIYNSLSTLNVSNLKNIERLLVSYNLLTILDVSELKQLRQLSCCDNRLTTINVSNLKNIERIECSGNPTSTMDISGSSIDEYDEMDVTTSFMYNNFYVKTVYLSSYQEDIKDNFPRSGEHDVYGNTYPEPYHVGGWQYPKFIYVEK